MSDVLTVGELKEVLDGVPDNEQVNVARGGAVGEATKAYRNIDGVCINGR